MNELRSRVEDKRETLNKHCALCGVPFHCGSNENGCWCAALPPLTPIPGRSCLCRKCLEEEIKEEAKKPVQRT